MGISVCLEFVEFSGSILCREMIFPQKVSGSAAGQPSPFMAMLKIYLIYRSKPICDGTTNVSDNFDVANELQSEILALIAAYKIT